MIARWRRQQQIHPRTHTYRPIHLDINCFMCCNRFSNNAKATWWARPWQQLAPHWDWCPSGWWSPNWSHHAFPSPQWSLNFSPIHTAYMNGEGTITLEVVSFHFCQFCPADKQACSKSYAATMLFIRWKATIGHHQMYTRKRTKKQTPSKHWCLTSQWYWLGITPLHHNNQHTRRMDDCL